MSETFFAEFALIDNKWEKNVRIAVNDKGIIESVLPNSIWNTAGNEKLVGAVIPGMPNAHSHAFQYALTGLTQHRPTDSDKDKKDNFWAWRSIMYDYVNRLDHKQFYAIALKAYSEMLKAGYTHVAEFHYVHNDEQGKPYGPTDENKEIDETLLAACNIAAAQKAGIRITMLPTFYAHSNFKGQPPGEAQRRFITTPEQFLKYFHQLYKDCHNEPGVNIGLAFHSLRAVTPEEIETILSDPIVQKSGCPIHIHIAEQQKEVSDCIAAHGKRPVEWFLENVVKKYENIISPERWAVIHATHMTQEEAENLAKSGVTAVLCPSTEKDLGDGTCPMASYFNHKGKWAIGSDSNTQLHMFAELKDAESMQRTKQEERNVLSEAGRETGEVLYAQALEGGLRALGADEARHIAAGCPADLITLDLSHPFLAGKPPEKFLSTAVFGTATSYPVDNVMVAGKWVVNDRKHFIEGEINMRLAAVNRVLGETTYSRDHERIDRQETNNNANNGISYDAVRLMQEFVRLQEQFSQYMQIETLIRAENGVSQEQSLAERSAPLSVGQVKGKLWIVEGQQEILFKLLPPYDKLTADCTRDSLSEMLTSVSGTSTTKEGLKMNGNTGCFAKEQMNPALLDKLRSFQPKAAAIEKG